MIKTLKLFGERQSGTNAPKSIANKFFYNKNNFKQIENKQTRNKFGNPLANNLNKILIK